MGFGTAGAILIQAMQELALPVSADPVAASDTLSVQMESLLTKACRDLAEEDWKSLQRENVLTTDGVTNPIPLPADFRTIVDQSGWDRTNRYPLNGPLSPQQWQRLVASVAFVSVGTPFRFWQNQLYLYPLVGFPAGRVIAFEYFSTNFVLPAGSGSTLPTTDTIAASGDTVWLDKSLCVAAVKLAWKREKGLDTTAAEQDFVQRYNAARDDDADGPVLNAGERSSGVRLLSSDNLPDTGWGA